MYLAAAALLASGKPMGFVAILGILALIGIIIRNSVILNVPGVPEGNGPGLSARTVDPWHISSAIAHHVGAASPACSIRCGMGRMSGRTRSRPATWRASTSPL